MYSFNLELVFIILACIIFGYVLGSIPFGLLITKLFGFEDIRNIGSGNIGATNVLRTGKKGLAFFTLILDGFKGFFSILIVLIFLQKFDQTDLYPYILQMKSTIISFVGFFSIIGHCFPIWLKFKGGKGVATGFGVIMSFDYLIGSFIILVWSLIFLISRISSLSSLISFFIIPFLLFLSQKEISICLASLAINFIVFLRHLDNVKRLIKKEEPKFKK